MGLVASGKIVILSSLPFTPRVWHAILMPCAGGGHPRGGLPKQASEMVAMISSGELGCPAPDAHLNGPLSRKWPDAKLSSELFMYTSGGPVDHVSRVADGNSCMWSTLRMGMALACLCGAGGKARILGAPKARSENECPRRSQFLNVRKFFLIFRNFIFRQKWKN